MGLRDSERRRLGALEIEYRAMLAKALRDCAAGAWGLLGANDDIAGAERWRPAVVDHLLERGDEIDHLRMRAGLDAFPSNVRLVKERALRGDNLPGEPRRAAAWLAELEG